MNYIYIFLLLLVVFSAYAESPQYAQPPLIEATIYPNSSFAQMGILAPVLPHNEVYKTPPHNEVYNPPLNEVFSLPLNEVYKTTLPHNEVYEIIMLQNEVERIILPQNEAKWNKTVLSQSEMFRTDVVNCHLSGRVKTTINFVLNLGVESFNILTSILMHGGEKLCWTMRILLESLQHVLKMYTWSLSENQASIQFRCRLIG
jgi:hypothetical protein